MEDYIKIGKFLSLILRHSPETIGITLDKNGWADVNELIKKINQKGFHLNMDILNEIVDFNNKKRYSFSSDKTKIRANQGHSIPVDVELKETTPPLFLYHGTATRFVESIKKNGLKKQNRNHVHLSSDFETAKNVGSRHGKPYIIKIKAYKMFENGYKFYLSENKVWLTNEIPTNYILFDYNERREL